VSKQLVVFSLDREEFALPIETVREIINYVPVTKLPDAPHHVEGVINVRGKIVTVVDFAAALGLALSQPAKQIIIVEFAGQDIGLTVGQVTEVLRAAEENFCDVGVLGEDVEYARGVYKCDDRIILLIDLEKSLLKKKAFCANNKGDEK